MDPQWFRQVLGQYPTGVCAITAQQPAGQPVGMVVGSFTSVSLDPALIAFLPDKRSTTWPKIQQAGHFCVNILASDQEAVCRQIASKGPDKLDGLSYRPADSGAPILDGVVAWIDCDITSVSEAGDHYIVLGAVRELHIEKPSLPLLFFRGGYGRFHPLSLVARDTSGTPTADLRRVDLIRPLMEDLARTIDCTCVAVARTGDDVVVLASAATFPADQRGSALVGTRLPFVPPTGGVFAAWNGEQAIEDWLRLSDNPTAETRHRAALGTVRGRGYSVAMMSPAQRSFAKAVQELARRPETATEVDLLAVVNDLVYDPPEITGDDSALIRQVSIPVFGPDSSVALALTAFGFGKRQRLLGELEELLRVSRVATELIGGSFPTTPTLALDRAETAKTVSTAPRPGGLDVSQRSH
jgi:flavin reductase (DIM6/NTAB) family NADH-FMN oxidoreductase RutF/DNA-binding IclR family transcriptional regulator